MVASVRDHPARRLELAARFYDQCAGRRPIQAYRRAETAFMTWQVLIRDAWEASLLGAEPSAAPSRPSVARWLHFLHAPSARSWYRAHNASIVAGYLTHRELAEQEHPVERFFMDVALVRVLYAQSLLTAPRLALGHLAPAGRVLADPRWRGADAFLSLHNVLPDRYPLDASRSATCSTSRTGWAGCSTTA